MQLILSFLTPLGLAILLGGLLGIERTLAGKTAGMRTYALVSMGSALFIIISEMFSGINGSPIDPLHLTPQILLGVGFIGAGLVAFRDQKITGVTSAAGLWVSAGVGIACGYGFYNSVFYKLALVATILTILVFTVLWFVEKLIKKYSYNKVGHNGGEE